MTDELRQLEEDIKIQRVLLQTLDIQIQNSPYNRQHENILRKKEVILKNIKMLEQKRNEKGSF